MVEGSGPKFDFRYIPERGWWNDLKMGRRVCVECRIGRARKNVREGRQNKKSKRSILTPL